MKDGAIGGMTPDGLIGGGRDGSIAGEWHGNLNLVCRFSYHRVYRRCVRCVCGV